eukprot:scaffold4768_cov412-Prasinococcus_capsulatus_cf.AAC.11
MARGTAGGRRSERIRRWVAWCTQRGATAAKTRNGSRDGSVEEWVPASAVLSRPQYQCYTVGRGPLDLDAQVLASRDGAWHALRLKLPQSALQVKGSRRGCRPRQR